MNTYSNNQHQDAIQKSQDSWRIFRIMAEFAEALETLKNITPAVNIYGSARIKPGDEFYEIARTTAHLLSEAGFSVITGGGPGIMEAGNRGAFEGQSPSIGLNIKLPHEQISNDYQNISFNFNHFFTRKYMFVRFAMANVVMPGGFGTLDELMETLTLIQTGKTRKIPVILMCSDFWSGFITWIKDKLIGEKLISPDDINLIQIIDEPEKVVEAVFRFYDDRSFSFNAEDFNQLNYL